MMGQSFLLLVLSTLPAVSLAATECSRTTMTSPLMMAISRNRFGPKKSKLETMDEFCGAWSSGVDHIVKVSLPVLEACSRIVSVVAADVAVPGQSTAVLVSVQEPAKGDAPRPVNVTLRLVSHRSSDAPELLAQNTVPIKVHLPLYCDYPQPLKLQMGSKRRNMFYENMKQETKEIGQGIVPLSIPTQASGPCKLEMLLDCDLGDDLCQLQTSSDLVLFGSVRDVIIRPESKYYKPGEKVHFWVLALDQDLHVATDVTGSVYVRDPSGTKVAIWEEVPLDEGVKNFELALSESTGLGMWRLEVEADGSLFSSEVNVSTVRGSLDPAAPEMTIAEKHYVELRFARETRRRYKPGLPFVGKVEAVSSERAVRVRVKVLDNTTSIYSQDIEISLGEGTFVVPSILSDSETITLQAELVSVGGKEIDSHYVLAKEPIHKWNSTSTCYLLAEGMENTLQPGDTAKAVILSSCPCDKSLHYVVTTEGHVTYWNEPEFSTRPIAPQVVVDGASFCRFNLSFTVEASMAPLSHLIVYYITDDAELISDIITFDIKLLQKQVAVNLEHKKLWYPGEPIDVQLLSEMDSLVCLVGGRGGEMHFQKSLVAKEVDFPEAGVSVHKKHCAGNHQNDPKIMSSSQVHHSVMDDAGLDQLWLWECFNYTAEVEAKGLTVRAPQEPGKWSLWALSVSPSVGLRFSSPVHVLVFRPIDVEFDVPATLKVGESLEVDIKIGNNVNSCIDVNAILSLSEGAHFMGNNQPFVAEKLRLGPHGATSIVVRVVATSASRKNLTVEVTAYLSETCQSTSSESRGNHSLVGSVIKQKNILVHPEGLVKIHTESAYFCANEQMVISTQDNFQFEFIPAPRNREGIVFEVRAGQGVHIALSEVADVSQKMYQVVIGDMENSVSWVGRGKHGYSVHLLTTSTPQILSTDESRTLWLSWDRNVVSLGKGPSIHGNVILKWRMDKKMKITYLGFATTWGHTAEFRIWNYNDEAGFSQVLHLDVPRSVLPGSEAGTLLVAGGLALPSVTKVSRPSLAEYSSLATTISSLAPLLAGEGTGYHVNFTSVEERKSLLQDLETSIQKLLTFRKYDGSFSDHHYLSSHWNTVSVLEVLSKAQTLTGIDPELLNGVKAWVQKRQLKDGSFQACGIDVVVDNSTGYGEFAKTVETTSDTLATLINIGIENENDSMTVLKARYYLEKIVYQPMEGCTLAMLCYALVSAKSEMVNVVLDRLKNASTNEEGEFGWPRPRDDTDWLYEEGVEQKTKQPVSTNVKDFKASLYTLMAYTLLGDLKSAEPVARYLFYRSHILDNHSELVFTAIKAFSLFGWLAMDQHRWLTVSLATSGMELTDTLELRTNSLPQFLSLPSLPTKVFVYATGAGCATVQGRISYATYSPTRSTTLLDIWAGVTEEVLPRRNSIQDLEGKLPQLSIRTCFKWKGNEASGVIRLEVHLFSGFELASVATSHSAIHYGSRGDRVWFVIANVNSSCAICINFTARSLFVVGRLRPAFARVYPAGQADLSAEVFFHTQKGSPLLADTTEDDLITWFGKTELGDYDSMGPDFTDVCVCGELCLENSITKPPTTALETNKDESNLYKEDIGASDFTDIIVFSELHENVSAIQGSLESMEEISKDFNVNITAKDIFSFHNDSNTFLLFSDTNNVETTPSQTISGNSNNTFPINRKENIINEVNSISQSIKISQKNNYSEIHAANKKSAIKNERKDMSKEVPVNNIQNLSNKFLRVKHYSNIYNVINVSSGQNQKMVNSNNGTLESTKRSIIARSAYLDDDRKSTNFSITSQENDNSTNLFNKNNEKLSPQVNRTTINTSGKELPKTLYKEMKNMTEVHNTTEKFNKSVLDSAAIAKSNSEKFLNLKHGAVLDILREGKTEESGLVSSGG